MGYYIIRIFIKVEIYIDGFIWYLFCLVYDKYDLRFYEFLKILLKSFFFGNSGWNFGIII